ncbi:MBL fold metallo-hydrolase [Streptomyces cavernicola]|uniref:MBL fold metallo-hydrolase n=1 Tax=Streptomyces cavernicola TaxID=3043613 RepID=A0ABT6SGL6_9ACTN|nr:MBL fold metallo-hydrolase [Streptomyces sp. B-S-A6]MDI3407049.1 MBL fold metallo-hydrolase [Streptomyces sp. B-S-A6]
MTQQQSESTTSRPTHSRPAPAPAPAPTSEPDRAPGPLQPQQLLQSPQPLRPLGEERSWPRSFADRLTAPLPGVQALARFAREGATRPDAAGLADIPLLPFEPGPLPRPTATDLAVTWVGHASWVVGIGGLTVLTDPVWSRRILGIPPRITPAGVAWSALPRIDAVVISHNHYDHLDAPTLKRLPRETPLFVPAGLGRWFRRRRFSCVTELDWWEAAQLGSVRFEFVPAHHWSKRTLTDTCRSLWGGWVLTDRADRKLYFAGDTGYGHWFAEIGRRHPGIDLALLPIGAYDPRWWLSDVHCDPEEAVRAVTDLGATRLAPMHWATFLLSAEPVLEPLKRVRRAWAKAGHRREYLWDLPVGASRVLSGVPSRSGDSTGPAAAST